MTSREDRRARFEALFQAWYPRVLAYAMRRVPSGEEQDVVEETFLVAWRRLEDVPQEALPWLLAVARRVVANRKRSARRTGALHAALRHDSLRRQTGAADPADIVADRADAVTALQRLSARQREAILLVAWEGLDAKSAASVLGCSTLAFTLRLHRARKRFAKELAPTGHMVGEAQGERTARGRTDEGA